MSEQLPTSTEESEQQNAKNLVVSGTSTTGGGVRDISVADEGGPLHQAMGESAIKTETADGMAEFLSRDIYSNNSAFVREYLQNSETACIRAAKHLIRNSDKHGNEALVERLWVDDESGDTIAKREQFTEEEAQLANNRNPVRLMERTIPTEEVLELAKSLGYEPVINITVHMDERKLIWEDNGIGMTGTEVGGAFMNNFSSGSILESDTGGKFGVGAKSSSLVTGLDAGMVGITRTRRENVPDYNDEGIKFYAYKDGANELDNDDIPDDFYGTKFDMPIKDDVSLSKFRDWVEEYTEMLKVPVTYEEKQGGETKYDDEFEATKFIEEFDNTQYVINRPGEFTAVIGPDVKRKADKETYLVSMPINRNTEVNTSSMWDVVVQIHNEQGLIISGPNRGRYEDNVDRLSEDDVPLPQPTGDRDRLNQSDANTKFFEMIRDKVRDLESQEMQETIDMVLTADNPGKALSNNEKKWQLLVKMVRHHGRYNVTSKRRYFNRLFSGGDALVSLNDEQISKVWDLFQKHSEASQHCRRPTQKAYRTENMLGDIITNAEPGKVYMGATINKDRYDVVYNTHGEDATIVQVKASKYDEYEERFGFKLLKEVPVRQSDDHDYSVPDEVKERRLKRQKRKDDDSSDSKKKTKPEDVAKQTLCVRWSNRNSSIDSRMSVEELLKSFRKRKRGGHIIMFPVASDESVTDHTALQSYGAVVSVTNEQLEYMEESQYAIRYENFKEEVVNIPAPTNLGPMRTRDMFISPDEQEDDKKPNVGILLVYDNNPRLEQLFEDSERGRQMREMFIDKHQIGRADTHVLVRASSSYLHRAKYAFEKYDYTASLVKGIKWSYSEPVPIHRVNWTRGRINWDDWERRLDLTNWDNDSEVYDLFGINDEFDAMLRGFHEADINPVEKTPTFIESYIKSQ